MGNITIGIEGLVGSGKTSLCRELINLVPNSILLNGGNLYRGIVVALMSSSGDIKSSIVQSDIKEIMDKLKVEIKIENRESKVYVAGKEIDEEKLQSDKISMAVSKVGKDADNSKLYVFARDLIDKLKIKYNIIISGRDLMKIYPNLDYHFFITASLEERVNRKANQYKNEKNLLKEGSIDLVKLKEHIEERDKLQEQAGFYNRYPNTTDIDITDCKSAIESANKVMRYIKINS